MPTYLIINLMKIHRKLIRKATGTSVVILLDAFKKGHPESAIYLLITAIYPKSPKLLTPKAIWVVEIILIHDV